MYTVYASYDGGPSEVIGEELDYHEASALVREKRAEHWWEVYMEKEEACDDHLQEPRGD